MNFSAELETQVCASLRIEIIEYLHGRSSCNHRGSREFAFNFVFKLFLGSKLDTNIRTNYENYEPSICNAIDS